MIWPGIGRNAGSRSFFCWRIASVSFFFLQDCVSPDYKSVIIWEGKGDLSEAGLPNTADGYLAFLNKEIDFLEKRNNRIARYCNENGI